MASIFAIGVRESFNPENPWVGQIVWDGRRGFRRRPVFWSAVLLAICSILYFGLFRTIAPGADFFAEYRLFAVGTLYSVCLAAALLGMAARQRHDGHPLLQDSFATPLTDRQRVAALHGRILYLSFLALLFSLFVYLGILFVVQFDEAVRTSAYRALDRRFGHFGLIKARRLPTWQIVPVWAFLPQLFLAGMNLAAGFYLRASLFAAMPSRLFARHRTWLGMVLAGASCVCAQLWVQNRYSGFTAMAGRECLGIHQPVLAALIALNVLEAATICWRLAAAHWVWRWMLRRAIPQTRRDCGFE
ncbi:hypothetical protein HZA57_08545 [Candidatus Poribacteria bacterium]|nr:hypothetical protein [Candidatus Poribacteria bacterium]